MATNTRYVRKSPITKANPELNHKVAIYVPIVNDDCNPAHIVAHTLCTLYGGATSSEYRGYWLNSKGEMIEDRIVIVYSYTDSHKLASSYNAIMQLVAHLKVTLGQESVSYDIDSQLYFF